MADWKTQISYNYSPSYHSYAYGLMYPQGSEQNPGNMTGWGDAGTSDLSNYNADTTPACYAAASATRTREEYHGPEQHEVTAHCSYQGSGLVYFGDSQPGREVMGGPHRAGYEAQVYETSGAGSDSTSDSDALASPDSWSSGSSIETSLPQADPAIWMKTEPHDEPSGSSPDATEDVSSSLVEDPRVFAVNDNTTTVHAPLPASKKPNNPRSKVRVAFSESQMTTLVQRFGVQRYLTPAEMRNMADVTGLTYKQVKTWFQNRRMKLRRHHKDSNWITERYNNRSQMHGTMYSYIPPYQGEVRPPYTDPYNQHIMEAFKTTSTQNLAFYLAAMGPAAAAAGPGGYHSWSPGPSQMAMPSRPQASGWSMPPGVNHYDYAVASTSTAGQDRGFVSNNEQENLSGAAGP